MSLTPIRKVMLGVVAMLMLVVAACWRQTSPPPAPQSWTMTLVGQWGSAPNAPTVWSSSYQVIMTPTVMNLGLTSQLAQIAFVSFDTLAHANADQFGVLRVINEQGHEIARFPDPSLVSLIPPSCSLAYPNLNTVPHLSPTSGLALGKLQPNQPAVIIGVLDDHTTNNGGIIAFRLSGNAVTGGLTPLWCSQPLPVGDSIPRATAPTIAQLDPPGNPPSIVIDNKVYDSTGNLRYTGFNSGSGKCANCPRSRTTIVADLSGGTGLPAIITGGGIYFSTSNTIWTGPIGASMWNPLKFPAITGLAYPAVADLDHDGNPEIIVTDAQAQMLRVFSNSIPPIAVPMPINVLGSHCGGPPMLVDVDNDGIPEIGVATCDSYTLFKYTGGTLKALWSNGISDLSGDTTSTAFKDPSGLVRIYYGDETFLYVFNGLTGAVLQTTLNTSATAIEGPVIAGFDTGGASNNLSPGRLIVSSNSPTFPPHGIRIFSDSSIGLARCVWNTHTYHRTNVADSTGDIPVPEPPSWVQPINSYRVQQW